MENLTRLVDKKRQIVAAQEWLSLIGKKYSGGGGGVAEIHQLTMSANLYYQEYDGATNYHDCPIDLQFALAKTIKNHFSALANEAMALMEAEKKKIAIEALEEYKEICSEAGIKDVLPI